LKAASPEHQRSRGVPLELAAIGVHVRDERGNSVQRIDEGRLVAGELTAQEGARLVSPHDCWHDAVHDPQAGSPAAVHTEADAYLAGGVEVFASREQARHVHAFWVRAD
jgi:hypothetical protein